MDLKTCELFLSGDLLYNVFVKSIVFKIVGI